MVSFNNRILLLLILFLGVQMADAQHGHIKLLAVTEQNGTYHGSVADLYLDVIEGSGRVFLDTFPLTQFDTQISTRFAKEIACSYTDKDCSRYDFFYAIDANSPIIAGASAGSSISFLTLAMLEGYSVNESISLTGTINSGGLVGPVGGVKEKIEAAKKEGIRKVLIPKGSRIFIEKNSSIGIENFSESLGIEIAEVSTLDEVAWQFTGKKIYGDSDSLEISAAYTDTMRLLAGSLCSRAEKLKRIAGNFTIDDKESINRAENLTRQSASSFGKGAYYSAASYCFGANIEYSYILLASQNLSTTELKRKAKAVRTGIDYLDDSLRMDRIITITDLEAYMIVKERLTEADEYASAVLDNSSEIAENLKKLAYAVERLNSAKSWAVFLDNRGKRFELNTEMLRNSCKYKLSEAEERYQYVNLYFPTLLSNTRKELDNAYSNLEDESYALCIFEASKAKASLDIILSAFYVEQGQVKDMLSQKLASVKRNLIRETKKGIFPVLGYSYYEYANSLEESDPYSSLLYAEYSLELSNLEIYFKEKQDFLSTLRLQIPWETALVFGLGLLTGLVAVMTIKPSKKQVPAGKKR